MQSPHMCSLSRAPIRALCFLNVKLVHPAFPHNLFIVLSQVSFLVIGTGLAEAVSSEHRSGCARVGKGRITHHAHESPCCGLRLGGACLGDRRRAVSAHTGGGALLHCAAQSGRQRGCGCLCLCHAGACVAGPAGCQQTVVQAQPEAEALVRGEDWGLGSTAVGCLDTKAARMVYCCPSVFTAAWRSLSCWLQRLPDQVCSVLVRSPALSVMQSFPQFTVGVMRTVFCLPVSERPLRRHAVQSALLPRTTHVHELLCHIEGCLYTTFK